MLYPNNPFSIHQYMRLPQDEAKLGAEVYGTDCEPQSSAGFQYSNQFLQLLKRRKKDVDRGMKAGRVFRKKIQLLQHLGEGSDLLATWIIASELVQSRESGAKKENAHAGLKATFRAYQDVAHLWAALGLLDAVQVTTLQGCSVSTGAKSLYQLLSTGYWFQECVKPSDHQRSYNSSLNRWLVPVYFGIRPLSLPVPELSTEDLRSIEMYRR
ncbi:hypothetical protein [Sulfitobacter sp. D7]|uniref:hypothetical protein n=1 Tax=Sulfitobacter sp. D7 TaxID=1968541 RepID=UPI0013C436D7|nr:hypothetical protein [Sulfitobacter sp. D7]